MLKYLNENKIKCVSAYEILGFIIEVIRKLDEYQII